MQKSKSDPNMSRIIDDDNDMNALKSANLTRIKKRLNADAWTNELEDLMQEWGEKAAGSKDLHFKAASYWKLMGDRFYIPVIVLSTLGGVTNFGAASVDNAAFWMYTVGTVNIFSAALAAIVKYYRPDEKSQNHTIVAKNFDRFCRSITIELGLTREERMESDEMIQWAKCEYDKIMTDALPIPTCVIEEYKETHGKYTRNPPDAVSNHYEIKINGRDTHSLCNIL